MNEKLKNRSVKIQLTKDNIGYKYTLCTNENGEEPNIEGTVFAEIFATVGLMPLKDTASKSDSVLQKKIWIVIHSIGDFLTGQHTQKATPLPFAQELLAVTEHSNNKEILPIIHLVSTDIFLDNMYGGYNGCEPIKLPPQMPRIFQIMDSSIWNYMVPLIDHTVTYENEKKKQEITLKDKFKNALGCIFDNYNKGLYYLSITNEYADLNARISGESFLYGSHAPGVSPFIFHSESAIDYLIEKEFNVDSEQENNNVYSKIKQIAQYNWRILLIDDKAKTPLRLNRRVQDNKDVQKYVKQTDNQFIGSNYDLPRNCKLRIIEDVLCEVFKNQPIHIAHRYLGKKKEDKIIKSGNADTSAENTLLIEYVETISDALYALKKKKYDFILLDYFLDKSGYGYELLETVYNTYSKKTNEYKYGPHGQLYFMFISAYSSAVYERLLAEGFNRSEDCWFIAVGACPTNTPKLFSYNLLQLMDKQLKDSGILKLTAVGIYNIVNKIYNADEEEVRRAANDNYQEILNMYFLYKKMLKDINVPTTDVLDSTGSVLITDFIIKSVNMGGLLEHLIQLVHLTALGTTRQWPEMWEEYIYFKAQFNHTLFKKEFKDLSKEKKIALFGDEKITAEQSFSELCHNIEAYILTLKLL